MKVDKKLIKELSEYLDEFNLTEIEFTEKDTKIKVSKNNVSINNQTTPVIQSAPSLKENKNNSNLGVERWPESAEPRIPELIFKFKFHLGNHLS